MKRLDFTQENRRAVERHRMSQRAWYCVFGVGRPHGGNQESTMDIALRMTEMYDDLVHDEISHILDTYLENKGEIDVS